MNFYNLWNKFFSIIDHWLHKQRKLRQKRKNLLCREDAKTVGRGTIPSSRKSPSELYDTEIDNKNVTEQNKSFIN